MSDMLFTYYIGKRTSVLVYCSITKYYYSLS